MKKVFVMMILILAFSFTSMYGLSLGSVTFHGSDGPTDTTISLGETVTVNFTYTTIASETAPIKLFSLGGIFVLLSSDFTEVDVTNFTDFSGIKGTNIPGTITFTMPALPATEEFFFVSLKIQDSSGRVKTSDWGDSSDGVNAEYSETLPVELSAFDAIATAEDFVNINWTVQSETNISGYFIIRGLENNIDNALMIPAFINATNGAQEHSYTFTDREVTPDNIYFYWLQSVEFSLQTELFGPTMVKVGEPTGGEVIPITLGTKLIGNYPNPFNPSTSVSFSVANPGNVTIDIYNIKGQLVKNLFNNSVSANKVNQRINVLWNGRDNDNNEIASGVYYTKMVAGKYIEFNKMLLMK